jgi:hypothetical protein
MLISLAALQHKNLAAMRLLRQDIARVFVGSIKDMGRFISGLRIRNVNLSPCMLLCIGGGVGAFCTDGTAKSARSRFR